MRHSQGRWGTIGKAKFGALPPEYVHLPSGWYAFFGGDPRRRIGPFSTLRRAAEAYRRHALNDALQVGFRRRWAKAQDTEVGGRVIGIMRRIRGAYLHKEAQA